MSEDQTTQSSEKPRWLEDIEAAMERASSAFQVAWEATREDRSTALESAKTAARDLGEVIEQGIAAARQRWETRPPTDTSPE